jgi:hypothetical protein
LGDLKNSAAYTTKPANIRDVLPTFETPGNWADNYGQRLTGFLSVPVEGDYVFLIASDDESELIFNASGEEPVATSIARCPWAVGRYNWSARTEQQSASVHLVPGKRYFIQALHKEGRGDDYLAVAYRKATDTNDKAVVIPGVLLSPPVGTTAAAFDGQMGVEAGPDIAGLWPKARYGLRGIATDYVPGPQPLIYRWSVVSAAAAARAAKSAGQVPKATATGVIFACTPITSP